MKILRTASLGFNFTGCYKKRVMYEFWYVGLIILKNKGMCAV